MCAFGRDYVIIMVASSNHLLFLHCVIRLSSCRRVTATRDMEYKTRGATGKRPRKKSVHPLFFREKLGWSHVQLPGNTIRNFDNHFFLHLCQLQLRSQYENIRRSVSMAWELEGLISHLLIIISCAGEEGMVTSTAESKFSNFQTSALARGRE